MANIIQNSVTLQTSSGPNIYFVFVTADSQYYNGDFESYNPAHWGQYAVPMVSIGPDTYQGTFPNVVAGVYSIYAYAYTTTPSIDDQLAGHGTINWNGSTESDCISDTTIQIEIGVEGALSIITPGIESNVGGEIVTGVE